MPTSDARSIGRGPWWRSVLLAGAAAVLFAASWPPIGWWPLAFVALAPLALAVDGARSARGAALAAIVAFIPAWFWIEWWLVQLTPPGFAALVVFCSLYAGFFAALLHMVDRGANRRLPLALVVPILWCAVEFLRARVVLGGYPWFQLGYALLGGPESSGVLAQSATLSGAVVPSAVAACAAGGIADLLLRRRRGGRNALVGGLLASAVFLLNLGFGWAIVSSRSAAPERRLTALAVQTNLPVSNKLRWAPDDQVRDVAGFIDLTVEGVRAARASGRDPSLVVWPETSVPGFGFEAATIATLVEGGFYPGRAYVEALENLQAAIGRPLLVGSPAVLGLRPDPVEERWRWDRNFNSAYLLAGAPPHRRYDKLSLTPFGEEMPLISRWDWLEETLLAFGAPGMTFDLDAGDEAVRFSIAAPDGSTVRFATPICFEDTLDQVCRRLAYEGRRRQVDLLVNLSNDGWFGWSDAGRAQHVLHARLRAVELDLPILRCANTGLSVLIDRTGRVTAWIGERAPGEGRRAGTLLVEIPLSEGGTFFGRWGDLGSWIAVIGAASLLVRGRIARDAVL